MAHVLYTATFDFVQSRGKERVEGDEDFSGVCSWGQYNENKHSVRYRVKEKGYKCGLKDYYVELINELKICLLIEMGLPTYTTNK